MTIKTQRASRLRRLADSLGILPLAFVVWRNLREWTPALAVRNHQIRRQFQNFSPIPPGRLIFSSTGSRDVEWFLESGEATAAAFRLALQSIGRPITSFEAVFELGCGCGRVLRHWVHERGPKFYASDYNQKVISWARKNLGFVSFVTNDLKPPLPHDARSFDLCYAVSVFTHLPAELQELWLRELHRVVREKGILLVTLSGEGDLVRTTPSEQERFFSEGLVVVNSELAGSNLCGVYHARKYVEANWSRYFRILKFLPQGAKGSPNQDLYVLERVELH